MRSLRSAAVSLDGIEAARAICKELAEAAPKIVLVTAYGREEAADNAGDVELSSILVKPVSASTLLDALLESQGRALSTRSRADKIDHAVVEAQKQLRGAHVLLVEDNEINQELALELLQSGGIAVSVACNGSGRSVSGTSAPSFNR